MKQNIVDINQKWRNQNPSSRYVTPFFLTLEDKTLRDRLRKEPIRQKTPLLGRVPTLNKTEESQLRWLRPLEERVEEEVEIEARGTKTTWKDGVEGAVMKTKSTRHP